MNRCPRIRIEFPKPAIVGGKHMAGWADCHRSVIADVGALPDEGIMRIISVMECRHRWGWRLIKVLKHIDLLACRVVGYGGTSAALNVTRPKVVGRASCLIETAVLTRPRQD